MAFNKKAQIPFPAIILIIIIAAMFALYLVIPPDNKILFPIAIAFFIAGVVLSATLNPILVLLLGSIYWLFMELFRTLNVLQNPVIAVIYSPMAMTMVVAFLIGKFLGKFILGLVIGGG